MWSNIFLLVPSLLLLFDIDVAVSSHRTSAKNANTRRLLPSDREARKLFGGYRITPRHCTPMKNLPVTTAPLAIPRHGPTICMFNHECSQRRGYVVGACMDGFLFGACCQLPEGTYTTNDLMISGLQHGTSSTIFDTDNYLSQGAPTPATIAQLSSTLVLPTAQDNAVLQISGNPIFSPNQDDTFVLNEFLSRPLLDSTTSGTSEDGPSTSYPTTVTPLIVKQPDTNDKYVLIPTITHHMKRNITRITTKKPPSTSYVYSATPTRIPLRTTSRKPPSTSYVFSTTLRPKPTTIQMQPIVTASSSSTSTKKPPSTSYVTGPTPPRSKPPTTLNTHIVGPGFTVTSKPIAESPTTLPTTPSTFLYMGSTSGKPIKTTYKPDVNSVTINQNVVHNVYGTKPPQPTVLITPKPSTIQPQQEDTTEVPSSIIEFVPAGTAQDELINFPPVRNPNLNMSNAIVVADNDITTPVFIEDDGLEEKVELFVNKIIQGLQEPFHDLRDVVYNRNKTSYILGTTKKPFKTTRKPVPTKPPIRTTSRKYPTRKTTTTKRVRTTKKPQNQSPPIVYSTLYLSSSTDSSPSAVNIISSPTTPVSYIETGSTASSAEQEEYRNQCGVRPHLKTGRIVGGKGASFGAFPWQVLVRESTWLGLFTKNKCGGVLISNRFVITAAHCQPGFLASLVAVFGEYDISGDVEEKKPLTRNVKRVIVHRQYDAATFANDLALLELDTAIPFDSHIIPICMPHDHEDFTGRMATVTGWGRLKYGGGVPSVLQEVQVPIMENHVCQEMFRTAGHSKVILDSFLCAGYANGQKDSCEGDSGGPLVLQRDDGRYQLAGTVSHGIKCAAPYLPGVYMRTTYYKPWLESVIGVRID